MLTSHQRLTNFLSTEVPRVFNEAHQASIWEIRRLDPPRDEQLLIASSFLSPNCATRYTELCLMSSLTTLALLLAFVQGIRTTQGKPIEKLMYIHGVSSTRINERLTSTARVHIFIPIRRSEGEKGPFSLLVRGGSSPAFPNNRLSVFQSPDSHAMCVTVSNCA